MSSRGLTQLKAIKFVFSDWGGKVNIKQEVVVELWSFSNKINFTISSIRMSMYILNSI
jgi:hypothetical protein